MPLSYSSTTLDVQSKRIVRDRLAVVWASLFLFPYLKGHKFNTRTDHNGLKGMLNLAGATSKEARWRLFVSEF